MKIAFVIFDAQSAWLFHRTLFKMLKAYGHTIHVIAKPDNYVNSLCEVINEFYPVKNANRFVKPLMDLRYTAELYFIFQKQNFDIVHNLHGKPNVFGGIAAFAAGVPRIYSTVQGKGLPFSEVAPRLVRILKPIVKLLYRFSFLLSDRVWFLNEDDTLDFIHWGLIRKKKTVLIKSVGVDIAKFSSNSVGMTRRSQIRLEWWPGSHLPIIGMIARLSWTKGVKEFILAAQSVTDANYILVGACDEGPDGVNEKWLRSQMGDRIKWLGFREDIRECIAAMDILVLPSFYPEGVPRVLLEGLAMGKPLITTDTPGCKEVVKMGENGFLIPPQNEKSLSDAINHLVGDASMRKRFGTQSRALCEKEFSDVVISKRIISELYV